MINRNILFLMGIAAASGYGQTDWQGYAGDPGGRKYSALKQIDTGNVAGLKPAWQYSVRSTAEGESGALTQAVPIVVDNVMYMPTRLRTVVALEPETGKELWSFTMGRAAAPLRGVSYWRGNKDYASRILAGMMDGKLVALDAKTGKLIPGFGTEGVVDLRAGVADKFPNAPYHQATPGAVYRNLIITGAQGKEDDPKGPSMDIRAWDVRSGKVAWTFHPMPRPGETGYETWQKDNWIDAGSPAQWGAATIDEQRGLIFLPIGQPSSDFFGGNRVGQNLFSSSVIALDANSGKLRWHFQLTHHDIWDYDVDSAPSLLEIDRAGKKVPALVIASKTGLMYFLNRETGKPIYPVEERPVPQSDTPGEQSWPTQPFPVKPPPLARTSMKPEDLFTGEPEHEKFCRELVEKLGGIHNNGQFTPYSINEYRIIFPGANGGINWGGVAIDTKQNYVIVSVKNAASIGILARTPEGLPSPYYRRGPMGTGVDNLRFWNPAKTRPCQQPPWAELIAVNANTGDIAWRVTLGSDDELEAKGIHNTGSFGNGGPLTTAGGLIFIAATNDKRFRAFETRTGRLLWETRLDTAGHANPITYLGRDGKQYVAIVSSGVNVFRLD